LLICGARNYGLSMTERGDFVTAIVVLAVSFGLVVWGFREFLARGLFE
jgi:hypothetical protein